VKPTPSKAKEFASVMAFKEACDCELLIRRLKKSCSVSEAVVSDWSQLDGPEKREKDKQYCF